MYTIGQFSRIGSIPAKTLRFYDEIGLLKPAQVDKFTQYRYYSAEQVADVLLIAELKEYGFSLEEIGKLIKGKDPGLTIMAMSEKLEEIDRQLERIRYSKERLEKRIARINEKGVGKMDSMDYRIELKEKQPLLVAGLRRRISADGINELMGELFRKVFMLGLQPVGPAMAKYYEEDFNPEDFDVEECVPVNRKANCKDLHIRELEGGLYASTLHVGPYPMLGVGYAALINWMQENGYKQVGPATETYLVGPENTRDEEKLVTELCIPVEKV